MKKDPALKTDQAYGRVQLNIEAYLKEKDLSVYYLRENANMQDGQLKRYRKNKIQRADLAVMARICYALDCEISDILVYIKPETDVKKEEKNT